MCYPYPTYPTLPVPHPYRMQLFVGLISIKVVTANRLAREYNEGLACAKEQVDVHNLEMKEELLKIGATKATIQRCLLPEPEECPILDARWCRRFLHLMQWKHRPVNTSGTYLEWNDPRLAASRKRIHEHIANGVHRYLILNVDQVWRQSLRPGKSVLMKKNNRLLVAYKAE